MKKYVLMLSLSILGVVFMGAKGCNKDSSSEEAAPAMQEQEMNDEAPMMEETTDVEEMEVAPSEGEEDVIESESVDTEEAQ